MADEVDMANELADQALNVALSKARTGAKLVPKGTCYFCDEPLEQVVDAQGKKVDARIFCPVQESDCAQMWEREQRLKGRR